MKKIPIVRSLGLLSDMHVGSTVAIWPKEYGTPEGTIIKASKGQLMLLDYWKEVAKTFKEYEVDTILLNGDLIEGLNRKENGKGLMASNLNFQAEACVELLDDMIPSKKTKVWVFSGSTYHESYDCEFHESIADLLKQRYPRTEYMGAMKNIKLHGTGVTMNIQHGYGGGSMYRATKMDREAMFINLAESNNKLDGKIDVIIRGHLHYFACLQMVKTSIQLPCWKAFEASKIFLPNYGRMQPDIGGVVMLVDKQNSVMVKQITDFKLPNIVDKVEVK